MGSEPIVQLTELSQLNSPGPATSSDREPTWHLHTPNCGRTAENLLTHYFHSRHLPARIGDFIELRTTPKSVESYQTKNFQQVVGYHLYALRIQRVVRFSFGS